MVYLKSFTHSSMLYLHSRGYFRFRFAPLGMDWPVPCSDKCFERVTWLIPDETNWLNYRASMILPTSDIYIYESIQGPSDAL